LIPRFRPDLDWPEIGAVLTRHSEAVERFEREFARAFHAKDAVAFPYGRSAQWAFFKAVGLENAEIIMPAYTCSVVAHAVTLSGNNPCFVDIRLDDYNMDLDLVPQLITERTRALIATHTFGYPQDLDQLEAIIRDAQSRYGHKIWLMQDCCHAFGAEWKGRIIGTSGDVAVYAFNISKMMTSIFGGMLTFQDKALATRVRSWRDANYKPANWVKSMRRRLYLLAAGIAFTERIYGLTWWLQEKTPVLDRLTKAYHLDDQIRLPPDHLDHMLDVEAAVGLAQLAKYPEIIQRRRYNASIYDQRLVRSKGWVYPPLIDGATYSHYVVRVPDRTPVVREYAEQGIHLGELIQYSIPDTRPYADFGKAACPQARIASHCTINFPVTTNIFRTA
jgi:perosamine synthetase